MDLQLEWPLQEPNHQKTNDPASTPLHTLAYYENKEQFEEAVQHLLREHEKNKPSGIFY